MPTILIIGILFISSASANDLDNNNYCSDAIRSSNNFTSLETVINSGGNVINLDSDYQLANDEKAKYYNGITLNRSITINGNGHIINCTNKLDESVKIFKLNGGDSLTLNNVTITGGNIQDSRGLIYSDNNFGVTSLIVNNSNFINNIGQNNLLNEYFNCLIYNSNFINNHDIVTLSQFGITINNCIFINNSQIIKDYMGDPVYFQNNIILNSKVINQISLDWNNGIINGNYWGTNDATTVNSYINGGTDSNFATLSISGNNSIFSHDTVNYTVSFSNANLPTLVTSITTNPLKGTFINNPIRIKGSTNATFKPNSSGNTTIIIGSEYGNLTTYDINIKESTLKNYNLTINTSNITWNNPLILNITLVDADNNGVSGNVNISIGNITKIVSVSNGSGSTLIDNLVPNTYVINAFYKSVDSNYQNATANINVTVFRGKTSIIFVSSNSSVKNGENITLNASLFDNNNTPLSNQVIIFKSNETILGNSTTNINGIATFVYTPITSGGFILTAYYDGSDKYANETSNPVNLTVIPKLLTNLTIASSNSTIIGLNSVSINATLLDNNMNPMVNTTIILMVNDNKYAELKTNDQGQVIFYFTNNITGFYDIKAIYKGDTEYNQSTSNLLKITVVNGNSFSDLAILIGILEDGDVLTLTQDYLYYNDTDSLYVMGIPINKKITINGAKHKISGSNLARIFNIANIVTINNITLINGNNSFGGAIYGEFNNFNLENIITINNTFFDNNYAGFSGGAIFMGQRGSINIINSVFTNNSAVYEGGAVCSYGVSNIQDSTFTNNTATRGGALDALSIMNITNSTFTDNNAIKGGAIYGALEVSAISNLFLNNNASQGGAICAEIYSTVLSNYNIFVNNSASNGSVIAGDDYVDFSLDYNYWGTNENPKNGNLIFNKTFVNFKLDDYIKLSIEGPNSTFTNIPTEYIIKFNGTNWDKLPNFLTSVSIIPNSGIINPVSISINNTGSKVIFTPNSVTNTTLVVGAEFNNLTTYKINVKELIPKNYTLTINALNISYGEFLNITINFKDANDLNMVAILKVYVDNFMYLLPVNGTGNLILPGLSTGEHKIYINYTSSDPFYNNVTANKTVHVKKVIPNMNITSLNITYGEEANITVKLNITATGNVTFVVGSIDKTIVVYRGIATLSISNLKSDDYIVMVTYNGDSNYLSYSKSTSFSVIKKRSGVNVTISDFVYDDVINGTVELFTISDEADLSGIVVITVNNKKYNVTVINGKGNFTVDKLAVGNYSLSAVYSGNENITSCNNSYMFNIAKLSSAIVVNVPDGAYNSTIVGNVTLVDGNGNSFSDNVVVNIYGVNYTVNVVNGLGYFSVNGLITGNYVATVYYGGNANISGSNNFSTFSVSKLGSIIKVIASDTVYGGLINVNVTLTTVKGEALSGKVNVTIDNRIYEVIVSNGKGNFAVDNLAVGLYNINVSWQGNANISGAKFNTTFNILPSPTYLSANNIIMLYKDGTRYVVKLTDVKGNPLANQVVTINIHGMYYNRTTDHEGKASLGLNLAPGFYPVNVLFKGTSTYAKANASTNVTIKSTITGDNIVKIYKNGTQYYATFLNSDGTPLANKNVTFNIYGVFYKRPTNNMGVARLNINLHPGEYIITAIHPDNGQMFSNNITVLSSITGKNIVKYYRNGTQYYATFLNSDGTPLANKNVTFNIYGVMYTRPTNNMGVARLNINLHPGNYIITAIHPENGQMFSNKIKVLPTLIGKNLTKIYGTTTPYEVRLVDGQGMAMSGVSIRLNIYGVFYNRLTDINGTAKLNINLMPGEYIVTAYYKDTATSNTIKVTN